MPFIIDQGRTFLIDILALIVVAPLLIGLVVALFRQSDRRRVAGSAGVAGGVIALGLIMYGDINQMQNRPLFLTDQDIVVMTPHGSSQGLLARRLALSSQCRWDVPWYVSGLEQPCQIGPTPCQDVASSIAIAVKDQAAIRPGWVETMEHAVGEGQVMVAPATAGAVLTRIRRIHRHMPPVGPRCLTSEQ